VTGPNWYDVLDVDPTATTEEVRDAWRAAIADLTPADRRFRLYNEAAEVLLDPQRRAAYDAELAESEPDPEADPDPDLQPAPVAAEPAPAPAEPAAAPAEGTRRALPGVPTWLLAAVAVLAVLAVALAGYLFTQPSQASVEAATADARAAAERAVVPVLSYDHRTLDEDQEAAHEVLTSDYEDQYDRLFAVVKDNAGSTQTVVEAEFVASAVVRGSEDRVDVLVFVNQSTTNAESEQPVVYRNQVRMQMERVGEEWLVDCMITEPNGDCGS
jgi:Mce-associated membrane protein